MKLSEAINLFLVYTNQKLSKKTHIAYRTPLLRFLSFVNDIEIEDITRKQIKDFLLDLSQQNFSKKTFWNYSKSLELLFKYLNKIDFATDKRLLEHNPFTDIPCLLKIYPERFKQSKRTGRRFLVPEDLEDFEKRILLQSNEFYRAYWLLTYTSLARISETLNIKLKNVNLEERLIWLEVAKGGKQDYLFIAEEIAEELKAWIKYASSQGDYLFPSPVLENQPFKSPPSVWMNFKKLTSGLRNYDGSEPSPHDTRRWRATKLFYNGVPKQQIQKFLRHSSLEMTERYLQDLPFLSKKWFDESNLNCKKYE